MNALRLWRLLFNGDTDQALAAFERGVAGGFIVNRADSFIPLLLQRGNRMAVLLLMNAMGAKPELSKILLAEAVARPGGPRPDARAIVERYMPRKNDRFVWRFTLAKAYLWLGDYDQIATTMTTKEYNRGLGTPAYLIPELARI